MPIPDEPKNHPKPPPSHEPPSKPDIPPHILKEIMDLKEKVGKLEGMIEVLLRFQSQK